MKLSKEPLIGKEAIAERIAALAAEIAADHSGAPLTLIGVLKGALPFTADLMRLLPGDVTLDFVRARSYEGAASSGRVLMHYMPEVEIRGRNILLIEDILDTGRTASVILGELRALEPAQLHLVALLDKPARRVIRVEADYAGFTIGDDFVVGYGLDYSERYRHLPAIYVLEEDAP